jgi:hypothetical protein
MEPGRESLVPLLLDGTTFLSASLVMLLLLISIYRDYSVHPTTTFLLALPRALILTSISILLLIGIIATNRRSPDLVVTFLIFAPHILGAIVILPLALYYSRRATGSPITGALASILVLGLALFRHRLIDSFS